MKITPLLETLRLQKIDDSTYFSKKYSNYISNSRLSLINPKQDGSPEKFFEGFKPFYSPSLQIGSAVHAIVLQPESFHIADDLGKPTSKMGIMADELYSDYINGTLDNEKIREISLKVDYYSNALWGEAKFKKVIDDCTPYWEARKHYSEAISDNSVEELYLDYRSRQIAISCIESLQNSNYILDKMHPKTEFPDSIISENEQAILLDIKVEMENSESFILKLKAKLDNYVIDTLNNTICVNDIKTLGKTVDKMNENIDRFHYNREFAFYLYLLNLVAQKYYGLKNPIAKGNYLVVSTIPGYYTKVVPLTKKMLQEGFDELKYLIHLVAENVATKYKDFGIWNTAISN